MAKEIKGFFSKSITSARKVQKRREYLSAISKREVYTIKQEEIGRATHSLNRTCYKGKFFKDSEGNIKLNKFDNR